MKRLAIIIAAAIAALLASPDSLARDPKRTSADVRRERQEATKRINQTKKQIEDNKKKIRGRVNELNLVESDIEKTNREITALRRSIEATNNRIDLVEDTIRAISADIDRLKESLAQSAREARSMRQSMTATAMIFSASTFKQAVKRTGYMRQLDKSRAAKGNDLKDNIALLGQKRDTLNALRQNQQAQMASLARKQEDLESKHRKMENIVAELKRNGNALQKELKERQSKLDKLSQELDRIIAEEQRRAEEERRKLEAQNKDKAEKPGKPGTPAGTADKLPTSTFAKNKGSLMMPVAGSCRIVSKFGRSTHSNLSKVTVNNTGIDIEAQKGAMARAVFPGTVSSIFNLDGFHSIVMLRHGEYLTIYANVVDLSVRKGDSVKAGQNLGLIYSDPDDGDRTLLHFEVRHEREKLDPLDWLAH